MERVKRYGPMIIGVLPLLLSIGFAANSCEQRQRSRPPDVNQELWELILDDQKASTDNFVALAMMLTVMAWGSAELAGRFLDLRTKMKDEGDKILASVTDALESPPLRTIKEPGKALDELQDRIGKAQKGIYLMYFREQPILNKETTTYWTGVTKSFLEKSARHIPIWRIASVDNMAKLHFLLMNNEEFFKLGGDRLGSIDYRLIALPNTKLKPPQLDIVDDTTYWFSTYQGADRTDTRTRVVSNWAVAEDHSSYFRELVRDIGTDHVLLGTSGKKPRTGKTVCGYSTDELRNIFRAIKRTPQPSQKLSEETLKLLRPYCHEDESTLQALYASARG